MRTTRVIEGEGSYLVTWFRAFYNDVVGVKQSIRAGVPVTTRHASAIRLEVSVPAGEAPEAPQQEGLIRQDAAREAVLAVRQRLMNVLERQENAAEQIGGEHSFQLYKMAQYVMAALADEVLLNLDWQGRLLWKDYLLESRLFQSAAAGDRVFDLIEHILQDRDAGTVELAKVCMMALVLDFQGRYRGTEDLTPLAVYRDALYAFIASHDASLDRDRPVLVPQAYAPTLSGGFAEMLPDPRRWIWVLVFVMVTLLLISTAVWGRLTSELKSELNEIQKVVQADRLTTTVERETPREAVQADTTQAP